VARSLFSLSLSAAAAISTLLQPMHPDWDARGALHFIETDANFAHHFSLSSCCESSAE